MIDWQTIAVAVCVLAAAGWWTRALWPGRSTVVSGCGSGCGTCPHAESSTPQDNEGFVSLDVVRASSADARSSKGL